jgi:hypothetical protein
MVHRDQLCLGSIGTPGGEAHHASQFFGTANKNWYPDAISYTILPKMIDIKELDVQAIHRAFSPSREIHDPELFVGRADQIRAGISALMNPGGFISIYGLRGVGKSSIAYQLGRIAEGDDRLPKLLRMDRALPAKGFNFIVQYISCDGFVKDVRGLLKRMLFGDDKNPSLFSLTKSGDKYISEFRTAFDVDGSLGALGVKVGGKTTSEEKYSSFISDDIIQQFLALLGTIRKDNQKRTGLLILIDEFDTLEDKSGFASIVKACSSEYFKFGIVGIAGNTPELITDHSSIGRQIDSIKVPLMPTLELRGILSKAEYVVGKAIRFSESASEVISGLAEGFPYFTHLLGKEAMLLAFNRLSPNVDEYDISVLKSDITSGRLNTIYESTYHEAVKHSPQRELLLKAFAEQDDDEIESEPVYSLVKDIGVTNPSQLMTVLTSSNSGSPVLVKVRERCYRFSDPVFKTYARIRGWKF